MTFYRTTRLMLSGVAFLSLAGSAFALDGQDLLKKINAAYTLQGGSFKPNNGGALPIGEITLSGVEEDDDGGYYIEEAAFPDINTTNDGATLTVSELTLGGISVPADPKGEGLSSMLLYESAHSGPLKVVKDGVEVFSLGGSDVNL